MKIFKFIPLFLIVLIVYNFVIFTKPEWMLEPELFDTTHSITQEPIAAEVPPPADIENAETPEELPAELIDISARPIASITLPSGVQWKPIAADVLLLFAVLVLYIELYKSTRIGSWAMAEHFLSFLVFLVFLAEFLMIRQCATSAFGIVMLLSLVDVIGGVAISKGMASRKSKG
ncbi:MAG: hypothetical protein P1V20_24270 [Verrucomicrobiales bacterium]|nr:hypothetical protein [Verrucomicrobiales bacterium]